jgi:O-antigen ligase
MTAALIIIYEFDQTATDRMTKWLIWTAWVAVGYGFLQFVDLRSFPSGVGNGIDPFIWRGAFAPRVFSTYGNPNFFADFLVIIFPILLTQFLKTKRWSLVPLIGMLLVDLLATDTKGAWVAFAIVLPLFGAVTFVYFKKLVAPYRKPILAIVAVGLLVLLGFLGKGLRRISSVSFRLFTWEATWEMIETQPFLGTGIGSFPPIYPAFRRPPIFHIEGKHNTETDHAEDEYLEELFDNGILGFGVFLWFIGATLVVGFRSLGQMTSMLSDREGRPPAQAYDLLGYLIAFMGMLCHNFFDVSLRFVSSGIYLGLLSGMIVALARGSALYEFHAAREAALQKSAAPAKLPLKDKDAPEEPVSPWKTFSEFLIWPARLAAWGALAYVCYLLISEFNVLQGPLERLSMSGEMLQWWLAWGTFAGCVLGLAFVFARIVHLSETPLVAVAVLLSLQPLYIFWGYFKADVHHNIAIYFSKERQWDQALGNYMTVHQLNPNFVMSLYFMGNVYNDRFNMDRVYNPNWGDVNGVARDDYERALDAYNEVRKLAPNYVQSHHQVGLLHLKRAEWELNHGHPESAAYYLDRALVRLKLYREIDPVFPPNYFRMGQIYMIEKKNEEAAKVYEDAIAADKCAVVPSLITKNYLKNTILSYQEYISEPGIPYPVHRHGSAEAYTNLANAYYLLERLEDSERAYLKALALDPNFDQAKRNIGVVYHKAQEQGRLHKITSPLPNAVGPFTGYMITPAKNKS